MFSSKNRESYEQEIRSLQKQLATAKEDIEFFKNATGADYKKLLNEKAVALQAGFEKERAELVQHYEARLNAKPPSGPDAIAVVEEMVVAAQNSPLSIELERAVANAVAWLEKNTEGD